MANLTKTKSREQDIVNTFKEVSRAFWNLMTGIMKKSESLDGEHYAYFIVCHMAKLLSNNRMISRAAKVGIYLDTQGKNYSQIFSHSKQSSEMDQNQCELNFVVSYLNHGKVCYRRRRRSCSF